jgi:Protein of unknown function (DUF3780)
MSGTSQGFGGNGADDQHRFVVRIPRATKDPVTVVEDYGAQGTLESDGDRVLRAVIERIRWDEVADAVRTEFNRRLKPRGMRTGRWTSGEVSVDRLLGKELVMLAWAIEDAPLEKLPIALANWLGLPQEQRWSLYTLAAAATGDAIRHRGIGWRRALMVALTENPVSGPVGQTTRAAPRRRLKGPEGDRASQGLFPRQARTDRSGLAA